MSAMNLDAYCDTPYINKAKKVLFFKNNLKNALGCSLDGIGKMHLVIAENLTGRNIFDIKPFIKFITKVDEY